MARPGCAKCLGYGAECPGYERMAKFVANKHEMRKRGRGGEGRGEERRGEDKRGESRQEGRQESRQEGKKTEMVKSTVSSVSSSTSTVQSLPLVLPLHNRAAFIGTMLDLLNLDRRPTELIVWGPWFDHVPAVSASRPRSTAPCVLSPCMCWAKDDATPSSSSAAVSSTASHSWNCSAPWTIRSSGGRPRRCAPAWCCVCTRWVFVFCCRRGRFVFCFLFLSPADSQLFADTTETSTAWTKHAQGVTRLMQQRGVDGYTDPWDRSMLFSFRALIVRAPPLLVPPRPSSPLSSPFLTPRS